MGAAAIPVAIALGGALLGGIEGATAPTPYQEREHFTGAANPQSWMSDLHARMAPLLNTATSEVGRNPTVSAPGRPAYDPHFSGPAPRPGSSFSPMADAAASGSAPGPARRSTAFQPPQSPGTLPYDTVSGEPTGLPRDQHAARLALLALQGDGQPLAAAA